MCLDVKTQDVDSDRAILILYAGSERLCMFGESVTVETMSVER